MKENQGLGGEDKLTDKIIGELSKYYNMTIRSKINDAQKTKNAVMSKNKWKS